MDEIDRQLFGIEQATMFDRAKATPLAVEVLEWARIHMSELTDEQVFMLGRAAGTIARIGRPGHG